jgi:hypothetical protein
MAEGAVVVPLRPEADASTVHVDGAIRGLARHAGIADAVLAWWSGSGDADAARLVLVEAGALERTPWRDVDGTPSGRIQASAGEAIPLADGAAATAAWQAGAVLGQVGWMAEGLGLARAALDLTAEYLRTRQQFGQPLARFQVLAHRMADLLLEWELAQSLVWAAAMDPDGAGDGPARADTGAGRVLAAQVKMHRLLRRVGQETIQLHGGIGMTDAYALAQLVRRMLAIELALGSADAALARYAALARDD